ncbi:hypothetical protein Celaphus_00013827 [Cervus elaphus hippelaphus]|uniref:Uncharacterized protein n=1 Tax=Cervus elaphus hippelaphus TaxID=46360 RepID=A0A212CDD2_CEREH|nr:hypothetical protein Celaphus_00013827 [Cervus elaphus hippelaphus]
MIASSRIVGFSKTSIKLSGGEQSDSSSTLRTGLMPPRDAAPALKVPSWGIAAPRALQPQEQRERDPLGFSVLPTATGLST